MKCHHPLRSRGRDALCDSRIIHSLFQEERTVIIDMAISSNLTACIPISLVPIVLSWIYPALNLPESHFGTIRKHWILDHLAPIQKLQKLGEKSWSSYPHPHVFLWKFSPQISWNILEKNDTWYDVILYLKDTFQNFTNLNLHSQTRLKLPTYCKTNPEILGMSLAKSSRFTVFTNEKIDASYPAFSGVVY